MFEFWPILLNNFSSFLSFSVLLQAVRRNRATSSALYLDFPLSKYLISFLMSSTFHAIVNPIQPNFLTVYNKGHLSFSLRCHVPHFCLKAHGNCLYCPYSSRISKLFQPLTLPQLQSCLHIFRCLL